MWPTIRNRVDKGPRALYYTSYTTSTNRGLRGTYKPYYLGPRGKVDNRGYYKVEYTIAGLIVERLA